MTIKGPTLYSKGASRLVHLDFLDKTSDSMSFSEWWPWHICRDKNRNASVTPPKTNMTMEKTTMIVDVGPPCRNLIYTWIIYKDQANLFKVEIFPEPHGLPGGKVEHYRIEEIQQDQGGKIEKNEGGELISMNFLVFEMTRLIFATPVFFFFLGGGFVREIKFMEVHLHSVMGWFIGFKDSRSYQWESCLVDLDFRFVDLGLEGVGGSKSWLLRGGGKWCFFFSTC